MEEQRKTNWAIIGIVALLLFLALWLSSCCQLVGVGCAVQNYQIKGTVEFTNECDGLQASIPNQVTVEVTLVRGNQEVGSSQRINLVGVGQQAMKKGDYDITVPWAGANPPTAWKRVVITPSCETITCPPDMNCIDFATDTRTFPITPPITQKLVRVACGCN